MKKNRIFNGFSLALIAVLLIFNFFPVVMADEINDYATPSNEMSETLFASSEMNGNAIPMDETYEDISIPEEINNEPPNATLVAEMGQDEYTEYMRENKEVFIEEYREDESYTPHQSDQRNIQVISLGNNISFNSERLSSVENISIKQAIMIKGVQNNLFPTFDDRDTAFKNLCVTISELVELLQAENSFDPFSSETIDAYMMAYYNYPQESIETLAFDFNSQGKILTSFLDIEENNVSNNEIIDYISNNTETIQDDMLHLLLPYNSPFSIEYEAKMQKLRITFPQIFNIQKGVDYAGKYAYNHNTYYGDVGADCTNFVSQILVAGDVNMHLTNDKETGWWHRRLDIGIQQYSRTWTFAPRFVNFMGTSGNVYSSFYTFTSKVQTGDFIAYDYENDGSWDHLAFVRGVGTYNNYKLKNGGTKYYRDLSIAQHTSNYSLWVSNDKNGWEDLDNGTTRFAIVRRNWKA